MTDDKVIGWYHQLNGHDFEQTAGDGEGQEGMVCCSPWGRKESDMTERLNNNNYPILPISKGWVSMRETVSIW